MSELAFVLPELLQGVFAHLDFETRCEVLPLVCKKWHKLTKGPSVMWHSVVIEPSILSSILATPKAQTRISAVLDWLGDRASSIKELRLRLFDYNSHDFKEGDFTRIFNRVADSLHSLHILKCGQMLALDGFQSMAVLKRLSTLSIRNWDQQHQVDIANLNNLSRLTNLTSLTLEMDIMGFPECITSLTGLEEVMLHKCQNMEVPCSISRLTGLKTLAMVECGMERLSSPVCDLPSLEVLNVSMNQLGQHQDCLPAMMLTLTGLKQLGLCCNGYDALPDVVLKLTSLQVLWLSGNRFSASETCLPHSLVGLSNLTELHLSCCQLTCLPRAICDVTSLIELNLAGNCLRALPEALSHLSKLEKLDLHRNSFMVVPPVIARIPSLKRLNILQNNIVYNKNTVALAYLPCLEELRLPGCGESWTWSKGGWSTRSFRYFVELVCKLSSCTRPTALNGLDSSVQTVLRGVMR